MRGLVSFALLFCMCLILALFFDFFIKTQSDLAGQRQELIRIELLSEKEFETKAVFSQVMSSGFGSGRIRSNYVSFELASMENLLEKKLMSEGYTADLWFGCAKKGEFEEVFWANLNGSNLRCKNCFDFSKMTIGFDKKPALLSSAFLFDLDGKMILSKNSLSSLPYALRLAALKSPVFFGARIAKTKGKESAVAIMEEGFS